MWYYSNIFGYLNGPGGLFQTSEFLLYNELSLKLFSYMYIKKIKIVLKAHVNHMPHHILKV
jgi:hypothetical protein